MRLTWAVADDVEEVPSVLDASEERLLLSVLASLAGVEVVDIVACRAEGNNERCDEDTVGAERGRWQSPVAVMVVVMLGCRSVRGERLELGQPL